MPTRLIREGILTSERIDQLDAPAEVFYRRLMSKVDDHGLYDGRPAILRANLFPLRVDRVREADISRWIAACEKAGVIALYSHDGKPYVQMLDTRWTARSEPKFPVPGNAVQPQATENSCKQPQTTVPVFGVVFGDVDEDVGEAASPSPPPKPERKKPKRSMPEDFAVSDRVKAWAAENGHGQLQQHLLAFQLKAVAAGYTYVDWDAAFMTAIREDWAKLKTQRYGQAPPGVTVTDNPQVAETRARLDAEEQRDLRVDPERIAAARALSSARKGAMQ